MGYLFAFVAVFCGATKGFCGKKISAYTSELSSAAYLNFLRMLMCIGIGFIIVLLGEGTSALAVSPTVLGISALSGIFTSAQVISWLFSVRRGAYMLVDVFLTVGVIVPMILSSIFYGESIGFNEIIGLLFLFAATAFLCSYSSGIKQKIRLSDILILTLAGTVNGLVGFSQKMFINNSQGSSATVFNFYTYVFSAAVLAVFFLLTSKKKENAQEKQKMPKSAYVFVSIMAVCLFGHSYFNTLAANILSAAQLYPLSQGAGLIISTIMASAFFGEKIKPRLVVGVCLAFVGLLIINLL